MEHIDLSGEWRLVYFPEGSLPISHPDHLSGGGAPSISACVPGNVELDLQRAGVLPDPFIGDNIRLLRPFEFYEWWYLKCFELPAGISGAWELVFDGLDTLATVWMNGHRVGEADNMFIEHRFEVGDFLRAGVRNEICVRLGSAVRHAANYRYEAAGQSWERREEGLYVRKAPHMWGWDIMPRAVSAGIWRAVGLKRREDHVIDQLYFWTIQAEEGRAVLGMRYQIRTARFGGASNLSLRVRGQCGEHSFNHECPLEFIAGGGRIEISGARLWWPKGYGAPHRYCVRIELCDGDEVLAERTEYLGLRTVRVSRTAHAETPWTRGPLAQEFGRFDEDPSPLAHFVFYVNDTPIMIKGTNWAPLDAFHSRDTARLDRAMDLCEEVGCNMIRCWGGNVYESDRFFDLCDEKGLLVWQDFAFACCRYPQDEAFLARVRQEAESVIVRLRNHPSLAIWCGDNEIDGVYAWEGLNPEHNRLSREVLSQAVHRFDPYRHYVPSSPYIPQGDGGQTPEQHLWGPRGYYKSSYYSLHGASFIGEIGYHGCPAMDSIARFIDPDHRWPWRHNPQWRVHDVYHWRDGRWDRDRIQLMANQIQELFNEVPDTLEEFVFASQLVQAEAKKFFIESARLRKWRTSGILWWNLLDGWPQFSDAVVDYYFEKKLAYHYIRRVQQPVCVIIGEAGSEKYRPVVLCNDTREPVKADYRVWDAETGETAAQGEILCPANQNFQVARIRAFAGRHHLFLIEWRVKDTVRRNHYVAGSPPFSLGEFRRWTAYIEEPPLG